MSRADRFPYQTATVLDQTLLDESHDNLTNQLEMIVDIQVPTSFIASGFLRASDRNKYVGSTFYEALLTFPTIRRTVGEWLSTTVEFSTIDLELTNVDGRFNDILPGGGSFGGWIGNTVEVKLGLRDVSSTYTTIFSGFVTDVAGFGRTVKSIRLKARDKFDSLNVQFPNTVFTKSVFADIEDEVSGKIVPVIYGDWTVNVNAQAASVPAFPVNGADVNVIGGTRDNLDLVISDNDNTFFDTAAVYLLRGSVFFLFSSLDIVNVVSNRTFEIDQDTGNTSVDSANYTYEKGDQIFVKVKGKDITTFDDNIVSIARDILETFGGLIAADFDANWVTYRDKAAPAESAISTYLARVWIQEPQSVMEFILSLLEQVRLEVFVDRDLSLKINSLHFDDFVASPTFVTRNWDVVKNTFSPTIDIKNNFNRAKGTFNFSPIDDNNINDTAIFRNSAAVTQAGKEISKRLIFPNLYIEATVALQVQEMIKLSSAYLEIIDIDVTWRSLLLDIGDFVKLNIDIGATILVDVPAMIRTVGYDPQGVKLPMQLFSFQMTPFTGYTPGFSGITGGQFATITQE